MKILKENWVSCPASLCVYSPTYFDPNAKVSQLITPLGTWDIVLVNNSFLKEEFELLYSIPIGGTSRNNKLAWFFNNNDLYTIKSGYWIAKDITDRQRGGFLSGKPNNLRALEWKKKIWYVNV